MREDTHESDHIDEPATNPLVESAGQKLCALRKEKGLSLEEFLTYSTFPRQKVEAFEAGKYGDVGVDTFVTGYIRKYCSWLEIDGDTFISLYRAEPSGAKYARDEREEKHSDQQTDILIPKKKIKMKDSASDEALFVKSSSYKLQFGVITIVLVTLAWLVFWLFSDNDVSNLSDSTPHQLSPPAESVAGTQEPAVEAPVEIFTGRTTEELAVTPETEMIDSASSTAVGPVQQESSDETLPVIVEQVVEQDAERQIEKPLEAEIKSLQEPNNVGLDAANQDVLRLTFIDDCWLEIKNSEGDVLFAGLKKSGSEHIEVGAAPFNVMLGNARAAVVMLNDEIVPVNPPAGRNTLRFNVSN